MRCSTRSAGNLKTPIRSDERMTSCVTLSRARPRKPFRAPGRIPRGALGLPDVGGPSHSGDQVAGGALGPLGEGRAPREAPALVGDLAELELHGRPELSLEAQPRAVRFAFTRIIVVQLHLDARIDALGVRRQEIPEPASDFRVAPAREHGGISSRGANRACAPCRTSRDTAPASRAAPSGEGGAGDRPLLSGERSALVEAAREALLAAFLVDERRLATLLAEVTDLLARVADRRLLGRRLQLADVLGEDARERVGQRE